MKPHFSAARWSKDGGKRTTRRAENARLGVETTTRCVRTAPSETKCLRRFIARPATPASRSRDEAAFFRCQVVQGRGQAHDEARGKCEAWRRDYNEVRPHSAIGNEVPAALHRAP